jgi:hypothetical protein
VHKASRKPNIARMMEDAGRGKKSDQQFYDSLHKKLGDEKKGGKEDFEQRVRAPKEKGKRAYPHGAYLGKPGGFVVHHYAANVTYDVRGWMDKNDDKLTFDILDCFANSTDSAFMAGGEKSLAGERAHIFPKFAGPADYSSFCSSGGGAQTLLGDFTDKLANLVDTLNHCSVSFVRCIKVASPPPCPPRRRLDPLACLGRLPTPSRRGSSIEPSSCISSSTPPSYPPLGQRTSRVDRGTAAWGDV